MVFDVDNIVIPETHKAVVYADVGTTKTKVETVKVLEPGQGEILVKLTHSGVCGSDLAICLNSWKSRSFPAKNGQIGGHEGVGHVVKHGPGVVSPALGSRVGIKWIASACLSCSQCLDGAEALCKSCKVSGFFVEGTFQQYAVTSAIYATPIPENLDSATAAPMLCAGVTTYAALRRAKAPSGSWVVIIGAGGGLGHIAVQLAARGFALRALAIDHGSKKELCMESGAEVFLDFTKFKGDEIVEEVKKRTGGEGANAVVVCTGTEKAYEHSLNMLRTGGTLVCVGLLGGDALPPLSGASANFIIGKQIYITGAAVGNRKEAIETLDFAARGLIKPHIKIVKMENLTTVLDELRSGTLQGRAVLDLTD